MNYRSPAIFLSGIIITFCLTVSFQSLLAAWVAPVEAPPEGNAAKPIYAVSPFDQIMDNDLIILADISVDKASAITAEITNTGSGASLIVNDSASDATPFVIDANGNVGIGAPVPGYKLDVSGNVRAIGSMYAQAYYYSSDGTLKKNIRPIESPLDRIIELEGVRFEWKDTGEGDLGLIAQDVEKIFPELVATDPATGIKSLKYGNLTAVLIEALKEQRARTDSVLRDHQAQIDALIGEVGALKEMLGIKN